MRDFQLIDSHQHAFWHGRDDAGLIADMDENSIQHAWVMTSERPASIAHNLAPYDPRWKGSSADAPTLPLEGVVEACRRYPERLIPGYCPNPEDPRAIEKLSSAIDIFGVRVLGEWKFQMLFDDPRCIEMFRFAGSKGLPVVLHLDVPYLPPNGGAYDPRWLGGTIHNLERALMACPDTVFIGHAPGFWRELSGDADDYPHQYRRDPLVSGGRLPGLFDRYANLHADLSAGSALRTLRADPDLARELITSYPDRLLFGRDTYGGDLIAFLDGLELPARVWRTIGRENAERLAPPAPR
jgi:predicted TIM-barrel fold metal-dependent hydrolase